VGWCPTRTGTASAWNRGGGPVLIPIIVEWLQANVE